MDYSPISIGLQAFAFVAKAVGSVASLGLFVGIYTLFDVISQVKNGVPLFQTEGLKQVVLLVVIPFVAFGIAEIADTASIYFKENAY